MGVVAGTPTGTSTLPGLVPSWTACTRQPPTCFLKATLAHTRMHPVQPAKGQSGGLHPASVHHSSACPSAQQGLIKTQCFASLYCSEVAELGALGRGRPAGSATAGQGPLPWGLAPIPACPAPEAGVGSGRICCHHQASALQLKLGHHINRNPPSASCPGWRALGTIQVHLRGCRVTPSSLCPLTAHPARAACPSLPPARCVP